MKKTILQGINSPKDVKALNNRELQIFAQEVREFLVAKVSKTGGHLASNLGTVELSIALHKAFSTPIDNIVFDVGHQCYTHKIITSRKEYFDLLRCKGGISGFPSCEESVHDAFISGHGNNSLSAAIGLATAKKLKNEKGFVVAIIGDGAFNGGMIYEGMNNIDSLDNLIVILNDNTMSISKNVGSLSRYLTRLRSSKSYLSAKQGTEFILNKAPFVGKHIVEAIKATKSLVRKNILNDTFFELLGFDYYGIANGNDIEELSLLFNNIKRCTAPVLIHIITQKGKGYAPAEQNPGAFHSVGTFLPENEIEPDNEIPDSFSSVFGKELAQLAKTNSKLVAITAAMKYGTGLNFFKDQHKKRFFDVGMAEQHAVTFAAGLAKGGMMPVVAIYSTFLQRSFDQIFHDVILQNLNVLFAVDRAGLVPNDGQTHQGTLDTSFLSEFSNIAIYSPSSYDELRYWLGYLIKEVNGPKVLRYPRGTEVDSSLKLNCSKKEFDIIKKSGASSVCVVTFGTIIDQVIKASDTATENGVLVDVIKMVKIHPIPLELPSLLVNYKKIIFVSETVVSGGISQHLLCELNSIGFKGSFESIGVDAKGVTHANLNELREDYGLDSVSLEKKLLGALCTKG